MRRRATRGDAIGQQMLELVKPVQDAYAESLGATELLTNVRGM